ncbi:hypothetical protein G6O69_26675 [Pseudenhygromyxa sp. WMMC2535]|uniref:hypothetical protein n=1 Tax=Pseudenhygromyxa sp. WMMC2535 TaxID=2712867 RepID=UPI001555B8E4|nr:hypothetical protein [Pseudenhygromyxa sp. WMMC2535]NVB41452.1 hypothetical protein [Pseudenhygromyxa sp. WMMC2535]
MSKPNEHAALALAMTLLASVSVSIGACNSEEDRCVETRTAVAFDEAASWGKTPQESVGHVSGERVGVLYYEGAGATGSIEPSAGEVGFSLTTTLDESSVTAVESENVGDGRLFCQSRVEMLATVTLTSDDGALQETLEVELEAPVGVLGNEVVATVALDEHTFEGSLDWAPADGSGSLLLTLWWFQDATLSARGWLVWGDAAEIEVSGGEVTGAGVARVLASFEATAP